MQKFKTSEESRITLTDLMLPSYSNFSGKIHGGHILSLMDQVAFACASKHSKNYCVTASVNRVDFLNPVEVGELLTLKASVNYTGNTSMVVGVRVESLHIQSGEVKHCNSSYFTMVAKDENGHKVQVPGLILDSPTSIRRFARSIAKRKSIHQRDKIFNENEFDLKEHMETLQNENAIIKYKEDL